jgi:hypothetical protein
MLRPVDLMHTDCGGRGQLGRIGRAVSGSGPWRHAANEICDWGNCACSPISWAWLRRFCSLFFLLLFYRRWLVSQHCLTPPSYRDPRTRFWFTGCGGGPIDTGGPNAGWLLSIVSIVRNTRGRMIRMTMDVVVVICNIYQSSRYGIYIE